MHEAPATEAFEVAADIPVQPTDSEKEARIDAFRAANLRVVALLQNGHSANSREVIDANEHVENVWAGRVSY